MFVQDNRVLSIFSFGNYGIEKEIGMFAAKEMGSDLRVDCTGRMGSALLISTGSAVYFQTFVYRAKSI